MILVANSSFMFTHCSYCIGILVIILPASWTEKDKGKIDFVLPHLSLLNPIPGCKFS